MWKAARPLELQTAVSLVVLGNTQVKKKALIAAHPLVPDSMRLARWRLVAPVSIFKPSWT